MNVKIAAMSCIAIIASLPFAGKAIATDYYVDSVLGNDSNAGTSQAAPWKTLQKVSQSTYASGDVVYLKRGSTWAEDLYIPSQGVTIDAYGQGTLPTLDSSAPVTGWKPVPGAQDLYYADVSLPTSNIPVPPGAPHGIGPGLGNVANNGALLNLVPWNIDPGLGGGVGDPLYHLKLASTPYDSYTHDTQDSDPATPQRLFIKVATNPNAGGENYTASTLLFGVLVEDKSDITVKNLNLTRFSLHGVGFTNCVRCEVHDLTISDGGGAWLANAEPPEFEFYLAIYAGNGVQWNDNSSDGLADGLTITNVLDSGISPQTFNSDTHISNITIRNSTIDKVGFGGIEISTLYFRGVGGDSTISGVTISQVIVTNSGLGWGGNRYDTTALGIRVVADEIPPEDFQTYNLPPTTAQPSISGVTISNTWVSGAVGRAIDIYGKSGTVTMNQVRITGNSEGIHVVGNDVSETMKLVLWSSVIDANTNGGVYFEEAASSQGFELFHNTFYNNGTKNLWVRAPQNGQAMIKNNVFAGTYDMAQLFVDNPGGSNVLSNAAINHNCYSKSPNMIFYGQGATPYSSIATFNAATGFESSGAEAVASPPSNPTGLGLTNPFLGDFSLASSSVCVGIGNTETGVVFDYLGQIFKNPPSAGAVENY